MIRYRAALGALPWAAFLLAVWLGMSLVAARADAQDCRSPMDIVAAAAADGVEVVVLDPAASATAMAAYNAIPPVTAYAHDTVAYAPVMTQRGPAVVWMFFADGCLAAHDILPVGLSERLFDAIAGGGGQPVGG